MQWLDCGVLIILKKLPQQRAGCIQLLYEGYKIDAMLGLSTAYHLMSQIYWVKSVYVFII